MPTDIALEDYTLLCDTAREFNEYVPPERVRVPAQTTADVKGDRPGDEYNRRAAWADILEPHGWRVGNTAGEVTYWTRPGKSRGTSATTGKCRTDGSGDLLYVFSSNAGDFEADTAYSKFAAVTYLEHAGDFTASAAALKAAGYGRGVDLTPVFPEPRPEPGGGRPDDGVKPDPDFATNEDLRKYDLGVNWVWPMWFQQATVNLLSAEGGAGKTRFMLDLCRRVHLGLPWPDGVPTEPWANPYLAMWVAGDRNHGELLENSTKFGFGERISYSGSKADPLGGITLNTREDFRSLYGRVKAAKPLFLVVDTAGGATAFNLAKQEEARQFFAPLSDMAIRLNLCVVVITHLNAAKNTYGKRAEERVRTVIRITSEDRKPETKRRLEIQKSNAVFPDPLGMYLGETGCEYDTAPPAEPVPFGQSARSEDPSKGPPTKTKECMEWLPEFIRDRPRLVYDIIKECESKGWAKSVYYSAKKQLIKDDLVTEVRDKNDRPYLGLKTHTVGKDSGPVRGTGGQEPVVRAVPVLRTTSSNEDMVRGTGTVRATENGTSYLVPPESNDAQPTIPIYYGDVFLVIKCEQPVSLDLLTGMTTYSREDVKEAVDYLVSNGSVTHVDGGYVVSTTGGAKDVI